MPPGLCNRRTVASHQPLATTPSLGHEARSFENAYMFLHRREAHRDQPPHCRNGELGGHRPHHDAPPRRIRQRVKQTIRLRSIYNHMVVDYIQTTFWETSPRAAADSSPAGNSLAQPMARSAVSLTSSAEPSAQRVCASPTIVPAMPAGRVQNSGSKARRRGIGARARCCSRRPRCPVPLGAPSIASKLLSEKNSLRIVLLVELSMVEQSAHH